MVIRYKKIMAVENTIFKIKNPEPGFERLLGIPVATYLPESVATYLQETPPPRLVEQVVVSLVEGEAKQLPCHRSRWRTSFGSLRRALR